MLRRRGSKESGARGGLRYSTEAKEGCEMAMTTTMDFPHQESGQKTVVRCLGQSRCAPWNAFIRCW